VQSQQHGKEQRKKQRGWIPAPRLDVCGHRAV
jgi:hypothetical protein